jgi:replicative DNA helicase
LKREHGLDMIVLDYLQLMQVAGNKENRATEISEISRSLKSLAKELGVPVIALSQLNRGSENRDGHRPRMSDLRESGSIEQDADVVMLLHRDTSLTVDPTLPQFIDLIIAKSRQSGTGKVELTWEGEFMRATGGLL